MKIGFYIRWPKQSLNSSGNVLGDELYADSMCRALVSAGLVDEAELYAPNHLPASKLDVMIYLNDTPSQAEWASRHVLYVQNAYGEGSDNRLREFHGFGYDGYAFISHKLLELHRRAGYEGIFLPFGVDVSCFYPRPIEQRYSFDVAYVGNDIKGEQRTAQYLLPATKFNFGLFGNWPVRPFHRRKIWKNFEHYPRYKSAFHKITRGRIPQEDVPILYSSAAINLNCTAQDCVDWDVITLRTLEVLACRGFLITDRVPSAERTMGDCMVFTDGGQDLIDKIAYYLEHATERHAIAAAGYEYVKKSGSIDARMGELAGYLETML
jgi:spore maturation protein CgeB